MQSRGVLNVQPAMVDNGNATISISPGLLADIVALWQKFLNGEIIALITLKPCGYIGDNTQSNIRVLFAAPISTACRVRSGIMSIVLFPAIILLHMHPISST